MRLCFILFAICFLTSCTSTIYIVRHAEKSTEPKNDPHLTDAGKQRAIDLKNVLVNKKVKTIYSTNTNRTKETAEVLSQSINTPVLLYKNDTTKNLFKDVFISKKNTLVVGHSNTILPMLDSMQIAHSKNLVPDWEYDNLIVIKTKKYCYDCTKPFKVKKVIFKKYGTLNSNTQITPNKM